MNNTFRPFLTVALLGLALALCSCSQSAEPPDPPQKLETNMTPQSPATQPAPNGYVRLYVFNKAGTLVGPVDSPPVVKTDEEWQRLLTPKQYEIVRAKGTERPFCGTLLDNHKEGVYTCVACGLPLFSSDAKFDSGTGWPSFFQPVARENVEEHTDTSYGSVRTEILCARCGGHLGHVFDDGPREKTGLRFCLNSESLKFTPKTDLAKLADPAAAQTAAKPDADTHK